ncbi:MAG TPA: DeoR/GlpR family DNA-binding transcription regulator [Phycisphaerae bacterium]|nr:DeoR/GlpR family DNA-binding transcription regulator [Phycisphaerae bacterium]
MTPRAKTRASHPRRREEIQRILQSRQQVSISQLARRFGVSEMTIRRDLDQLESQGRVRRTHGGALPAERMVFEFDFVARRQANRPAKQAIAAEAVKRVHPGHRLILDTGTTTLELARLLKPIEDLTVITPSLAVASELQYCDNVQTVLLGGVVRRGSPDLTGMVAEAVLDMFSADLAFQGADGIGLDGALYTQDMRIAKVDQKIRSRARQTYVLADSTKIGKTALTRHGFLPQVEALITDARIRGSDKAELESKGATVIVAS